MSETGGVELDSVDEQSAYNHVTGTSEQAHTHTGTEGVGQEWGRVDVQAPPPPGHVTGTADVSEEWGRVDVQAPPPSGHVTGTADVSEGHVDVQAPPPPGHVTGTVDLLTQHINAHIQYYRLVPSILGFVGVALLIRAYHSVRPITRIRQVAGIPRELVVKNRRLTGVVMTTGWNTVGVWHVPSWRWTLRWRTHPPSENCPAEELLTVQFSGVTVGNPTYTSIWLKERLLGKKVWLTLLDHTSQSAIDQKAVKCIVHTKNKGLLKWLKACVNKDLVLSGVGSVEEVTGFTKSADLDKFVAGLVHSENIAKAKGQGVWAGSKHSTTTWNRLKRYFRS